MVSGISVVGISLGTFALIVVLSVFNGFEDVIKGLYNVFNPDLEIKANLGKTFNYTTLPIDEINAIDGVKGSSKIIEEDALFKYGKKQFIGKIKAVDENFINLSGVDSMVVDGYFILEDAGANYAVVGAGLAWFLDLYPDDIGKFLNIYVPKRGNKSSFNLKSAFKQKAIHPAGVFSIQQEFDEKYVFIPFKMASELMDYNDEISSLEVFFETDANTDQIQSKIESLLGEKFSVKNRYQQNMALFKVMSSEKTAIFFILIFILVLASFNMVGSLSILIVEKKKDIGILKSMGADKKLINRIFLSEGMMISLFGSIIGLSLGFIILWLQQTFGFISLGSGNGDFIIDAYPVKMNFIEFIYVFIIVQIIGFLASWYPVKVLLKRYSAIKPANN